MIKTEAAKKREQREIAFEMECKEHGVQYTKSQNNGESIPAQKARRKVMRISMKLNNIRTEYNKRGRKAGRRDRAKKSEEEYPKWGYLPRDHSNSLLQAAGIKDGRVNTNSRDGNVKYCVCYYEAPHGSDP